MGTVSKKVWIPTDASMTVEIVWYEDLEDGDTFAEAARAIAQEDFPDAEARERLEKELREKLYQRIDGEIEQEIHDISYEIDWNSRTVYYCEWCNSPECDGDGDCDEAPEWCDGCEEYTDHECDCVWCDECETYNCEVDHSTPSQSPQGAGGIDTRVQWVIVVPDEEVPEVEAEL